MRNEPEETRFPTLPDGWADGTGLPPKEPLPPSEKLTTESRDLTTALVVIGGLVTFCWVMWQRTGTEAFRSLSLGGFGVTLAWIVRLGLMRHKRRQLPQ